MMPTSPGIFSFLNTSGEIRIINITIATMSTGFWIGKESELINGIEFDVITLKSVSDLSCLLLWPIK